MLKVTKPGALVFINGRLTIHDWSFYDPSMSPTDSRDVSPADSKAVVLSVLVFLAEKYNVSMELAEPVERFTLDQERAALDVIAQARWVEKE